jgi:undecaprenyl diphosphate synthase
MNNLPTHIGFIPDGNRRWAAQKNLPTIEGHRRGLKKVEQTIEFMVGAGVKNLTFYLFSTENWSRSADEVKNLMNLASSMVIKIAEKMAKNDIKLIILGSEENVPENLKNLFQKAEELTKNGKTATVAICFNYGGLQEIADATKSLAKNNQDITPESIRENLYHPELPDLDLIVRTSGEERLSGFMLYRAAYAELLFLKKFYPALNTSDFKSILEIYEARTRRFGK